MQYPDQSGTPAADGLESAPDMEQGAAAISQGEGIHIASDMLPNGIAEGDMLKCTGMDENGCSFELVKGAKEEQGEDWETGFRREMSPTQPTAEAS